MQTTLAGEVPKSLQLMIADAKNTIDRWDFTESPMDDVVMKFVHDWALQLSRGEFDDKLFWKCTAEDREECGDWMGAVAATKTS